jgi:hypothetical protein
MARPARVAVPSAAEWAAQTPPWAHGRRERIVGRILSAGFAVEEQIDPYTNGTTYGSADGSVRVQRRTEWNERGADYESVRVTAGGEVVAELRDAALAGPVEFPTPWLVMFPVCRDGRRERVWVDVRARTYGSHPLDERPPGGLPAVLAYLSPTRPRRQPWRRRDVVGNALGLFGCLVFVAAGSWMAVAGRKSSDWWQGGLGALFFAACAVAYLLDLLAAVSNRRGQEEREGRGPRRGGN